MAPEHYDNFQYPDGTGIVVATADEKFTGTYQDKPVTMDAAGTQAFTWRSSHGELQYRTGKHTGTLSVYNASGTVILSVPFAMTPAPTTYTCTKTTLQMNDVGDAGAEELTRSASPAPPPSPTPASTLDACLVGTWAGGADVNPATINGTAINLTGPHGPAYTFNANGTGTEVSTASDKLSGTYQGVPLTAVVVGTEPFTWHTGNGDLDTTAGKATGTTTVYNASTGKAIGSEPYHTNPGGTTYSCTSTTLRIADTTDDGTETLTRG